MTYRKMTTLMAMVALMICSACAEKPSTAATTTLITPASQQISALRWDEMTAATSAAKVNNNGLIIMR